MKCSNYADELRRPSLSIVPKHVRKAEAYIENAIGGTLTVARVADHLGISVRALFDGFQNFRGVTPGEFIRNLRLDRAGQDLLAGQVTVTDVALKWGYSHVGNFAARYRERFNELPVQTLRVGG